MAKILVIDDNEIQAKAFSKRLAKRGHSVDYRLTGLDCLNFLDKEVIPNLIIILDLVMPEMDGLEVLKKIRREYTEMELPVIILSGENDTEKVVECLSEGANDYLVKPFNIEIAAARISTQNKLVTLYKENLQKKQYEMMNSMVATYNHEINNPLTIAIGSLNREYEKVDEKRIDITLDALNRISEIVKKIDSVTRTGEAKQETYMEKTKMIKLK